jgi:hypothetical protein
MREQKPKTMPGVSVSYGYCITQFRDSRHTCYLSRVSIHGTKCSRRLFADRNIGVDRFT